MNENNTTEENILNQPLDQVESENQIIIFQMTIKMEKKKKLKNTHTRKVLPLA